MGKFAAAIEDGGSHVDIPRMPEGRDSKDVALSSMSKEEWMNEYGAVLSSERRFLEKDPDWVQNKKSWWYKVTGRDGEEPPLWMQEQVRAWPVLLLVSAFK